VWAWGLNGNGQPGDGTTTDRSTPVQVQNLSGVRAVAGGAWHSLALKGDDGTVWAWGWNAFGELGDGTTNDSYTPVQVQNLGGITAIAAGDASNLALTTNGIVQAWGANDTGELGDGTTIDRHTPVTVLNLSGTPFSVAIAIAAGSAQSLAIVKVLPAVVEPPYLAVKKLLAYPSNRFRPPLFNLQIDGVTVRANVTSGSTRLLEMGSGNHIVSETVSTGTDPDEFTAVIGGDCAPDGTVNLAPGDKKVCTITNYDHFGGCGSDQCCKPGEGVQGCQDCRKACP
jgi:alpha-tubulin suppressor-like RCC1 family protein